jgi:hypothetical protein
MHIKGSGGFDAEKFQKLVAMLDSPSTGEVANAFRLAIAELKKRLKFVDQTGSSAEAIKVQLECEAARLDLQKELNTAKRKGASSDELKAIIERLYRRISMLEEAASHASPSQPPEPDWAEEYMHEDPVQPEPPQQQPVQPKPVHETPAPDNFIHEDEYVDQDPAPKHHAVATIPLDASRRSAIGPAFIARLENLFPQRKTFWVALASVAILIEYVSIAPHPVAWALVLASAVLLILLASAAVWVICLTIGYGRDPFTWSIYHRSLWAPHQLLSMFFLVLAMLAVVFLPEAQVYWLLDEENDKLQNWIVYPACWAFVFAIVMHFDPTFFGKAPKPAPAPTAAVAHHTHHHRAHHVAFQLAGPAVVHASDGSPGSSDDNGSDWVLWPVAGIAVLFLIGSRNRAKARKQRAAAQEAAHIFTAPNVHGNAGYASKSDARKKGWL